MTGEHNVSGRSSAYGDNAPDSAMPPIGVGVNQTPRSETNTLDVPTTFTVSSVYSVAQVYIANLHMFLKASDSIWTYFNTLIFIIIYRNLFYFSLY